METYECNVVFLNEKYGEFQYTIEGTGELPEPIKRFENKECSVEENFDFTLELELQNKYLQDTLRLLKTEKVEKTLKKLKTLASPEASSSEKKIQFSIECRSNNFTVPNVLTYTGEFLQNTNKTENPLDLTSPTSIKEKESTIKETSKDKSEKNKSDLEPPKIEILKFPVKFYAKICQTYECDVILRNLDNPLDIQLIKLSVLVKPKNIFAKIEFNCPVLCEITQKIPIYNNSEVDWTVKFELTDNCIYFYNN